MVSDPHCKVQVTLNLQLAYKTQSAIASHQSLALIYIKPKFVQYTTADILGPCKNEQRLTSRKPYFNRYVLKATVISPVYIMLYQQ